MQSLCNVLSDLSHIERHTYSDSDEVREDEKKISFEMEYYAPK